MRSIKWILLILEIALFLAIFNSCVGEGYFRIFPEFAIGGINSNGEYDENDLKSVCTVNKISVAKLRIEKTFTDKSNVNIFWYDENDYLIGSVGGFSVTSDIDYLAFPKEAKYFRISITHPTADWTDWDIFWLPFTGIKIETSKKVTLEDRWNMFVRDAFPWAFEAPDSFEDTYDSPWWNKLLGRTDNVSWWDKLFGHNDGDTINGSGETSSDSTDSTDSTNPTDSSTSNNGGSTGSTDSGTSLPGDSDFSQEGLALFVE